MNCSNGSLSGVNASMISLPKRLVGGRCFVDREVRDRLGGFAPRDERVGGVTFSVKKTHGVSAHNWRSFRRVIGAWEAKDSPRWSLGISRLAGEKRAVWRDWLNWSLASTAGCLFSNPRLG